MRGFSFAFWSSFLSVTHLCPPELLSLRQAYEASQARTEALSQESVEHYLRESSLEAALSLQASQWQEAAVKMEDLRASAEQERTELREEKAR